MLAVGLSVGLLVLTTGCGDEEKRDRARPLPAESPNPTSKPSGPTFGPGKARVGTDMYPMGVWVSFAPRPDACHWQAIDRKGLVLASGTAGPTEEVRVRTQTDWDWFESSGCGWWRYLG